MSIYVEILIRGDLDALWRFTQQPDLHERWDLRFTRIEYLPRASDAEPQRFRYSTRIGFGLEIEGEGVSVGERNLPDGSRTSALKFSSGDARSIIREGSGYWKYIPSTDGIRFLTGYDYDTRFGLAGRLFDRAVFRPLMGWATAWSFDRLRLWIEDRVEPAHALRQAVAHTIARGALSFIFLYHGIVPKLLTTDPAELSMLADTGVPAQWLPAVLKSLGLAEISFAIVLLVFGHRRWPLLLCIAAMITATVGVAGTSPAMLSAAFNPVTLNCAIVCLAAIDLAILPGVPSAARCLRKPPPPST